MEIELRDPNIIMKLSRLGSFHQSKLSFLRSFLSEFKDWEYKRDLFDLDKNGFGVAVYSFKKKDRVYSLVCFANEIHEHERSDRVIATKKNAAKSIHSGAVKYIAAEMAKCVVDDSDTILGSVACPGTGGTIADAYVGLSQDKNPWSTSNDAASKVASKPDTVAKGNLYLIVTEDAPNDIEILMSDGDSEFTTTLSVE